MPLGRHSSPSLTSPAVRCCQAVDPEDVLPEGWVEPEGEGKNRRNWEEEAVAAVTGGDLSMLITAAALQRASAR